MTLEEAAHLVSEWASEKPQIQKIQFFGSRVKGTHHEKSDLDIAITLAPNLDESGGLSTWFQYGDDWGEELNVLIPLDVQAEWEAGEETPTIHNGLIEANHIVYEK